MTSGLAVLCIEHKHGINTHICDNVQTAWNILHQWVQEYWEPVHYGEMPDDPDIAVEVYFGIDNCHESYTCECHLPILTADDVVYNKEAQ